MLHERNRVEYLVDQIDQVLQESPGGFMHTHTYIEFTTHRCKDAVLTFAHNIKNVNWPMHTIYSNLACTVHIQLISLCPQTFPVNALFRLSTLAHPTLHTIKYLLLMNYTTMHQIFLEVIYGHCPWALSMATVWGTVYLCDMSLTVYGAVLVLCLWVLSMGTVLGCST